MVETRPSGAHRWTKCAAAPLFASRAGPQPEGDPAREGTCAAWVAELVLTGKAAFCSDLIGECHPNGWEVDAEMAGHIQNYCDMIRREGGFISAERFVRLSELVAGTLDNSAAMLDGVLRVRDLKYGFRLINPDVEQLVIYGGALAAELINSGQTVTKVVTEIYQPRGFSPHGIHRRKEWSLPDLFNRCDWIIACAKDCHKPNPTATPGPWCLECDGATGCAALASTTANLLTLVQSEQHSEMSSTELSERLKFIREAKKIIDAAASAVESEALARKKAGERIPGFGMKEQKGHAKLNRSREAVYALTGIDPVNKKLMSPAQLRAAGASKAMVEKLSITPVIGHKLEPLDEKDLAAQFSKG